jgi:hypothetical protein
VAYTPQKAAKKSFIDNKIEFFFEVYSHVEVGLGSPVPV